MIEPAALTRQALDRLHCQVPGCTHDRHDGFVLHGACHIGSPALVRYWINGAGAVTVHCHVCGQLIVRILLDAEDRAQANAFLAPHHKTLHRNPNLVFRAKCHRDAGVFVTYEEGQLLLTCGECCAPAGIFHVASEESIS